MVRTVALVLFSLLMFAANSLLARHALGGGQIDAASFSAIRLTSGALVLFLLSWRSMQGRIRIGGDRISAMWLLLYAVPFSFAYLGMGAGAGALVLFGAVQLSMMTAIGMSGVRPPWGWYLGVAAAFGGLIYLLLPGIEAPPILSASLMALAGVAWGLYTMRGKKEGDALQRNAGNFMRTVPWVAVVWLLSIPLGEVRIEPEGAIVAVLSGAVASALGYVAWYAALRHLPAASASSLQLSVPVLAAVGGAVLLAEPITLRMFLSAALVLGGVGYSLICIRRT